MTDRELLELAAKAAGIEIDSWVNDSPVVVKMFRGHLPNYEEWNPLTDDGDALRLAVKVCITLVPYPTERETRRAIVCAAAEFGRVTP